MGFFSRMSRQSTSPDHNLESSGESWSPVERPGSIPPQPASSLSNNRMSKDSVGYPSWLPERPPPPAPRSTFQSSIALAEPGPSDRPFVGGRKPTPRSVRIVSLTEDRDSRLVERREPTDHTRVGSAPAHLQGWSRATAPTFNPTGDLLEPRVPQPKFHARGLNLDLLQSPLPLSRIYFYLFRLFIFVHIPLQTFLDFNAVFIIFQVARFPNPEGPGVPGSGRNWTLGAAAYIACWAAWIFGVFIVYELLYSFVRRWRVKRPLMYPIYLSSPAFNFVAVSSYTNFCFLQHVRYNAFFGAELGSMRDGLAETFNYYSQNLPTVALLLPRAGLSLALLLSFSSPQLGMVVLADQGIRTRDSTFFRTDGTLSGYARGVLLANAAWTLWRALVLLTSWIGLWVVSGQGCAGLCGPRDRWEEEEVEKTMSMYSENVSDIDALPWDWRECTRVRILDSYEFCRSIKRRPISRVKKEATDMSDFVESPLSADDGVERILAAVGLGSAVPVARRGVLTDDFFSGPGLREDDVQIVPRSDSPPELSDIYKVVRKPEPASTRPLSKLPYPFTLHGAAISSKDKVPFPPSPQPSDEGHGSKSTKTQSHSGSGTQSSPDGEEEEDDDDDDEEDEGDDEGAGAGTSEEPSSGRASGSMSSLGQPVSSRYPFQFRRPARGTSGSSAGATSHLHSHSNSNSHSMSNPRSIQSRISQGTQSTGNFDTSTDSGSRMSPKSHYPSSSDVSGIPMPPRHPRSRDRAGTVPGATPNPVAFPRARARTRAESGMTEMTEAFGFPGAIGPSGSIYLGSADVNLDHSLDLADSDSDVEEEALERPVPDGPQEAIEGEDVLGLLSTSRGPSPRSSLNPLRQRTSTLSLTRHRTRSGSGSRSTSQSGSSSSRSRADSMLSVSVRSRAQSLLQNMQHASHSSLELVQGVMRTRANSSMARLEEDTSSDARTHSRSNSGSDAVQSRSSGENYTFGQPLRTQWQTQEGRVEEEGSVHSDEASPVLPSADPTINARPSQPSPSVSASSLNPSERTAAPPTEPARSRDFLSPADAALSERSSHPDISSAAPSFVTAPVTIQSNTESSGGDTASSWGTAVHGHMRERTDSTWRPA